MALDQEKHTIKSLLKIIKEQQVEIDRIKERVFPKAATIQRVETVNGETPAIPREKNNLEMDYESKIQSMKNACAILPPNMIVDGRHTLENVEAICGFKATHEMMDEVYS